MDKFLKRKRQRDSSSDSDEENFPFTNLPKKPLKKTYTSGKVPTRKYDESYLKFGFVCKDADKEPKPQCVLCLEVLANASMKPSKLIRHQKTKHSDTILKPIQFFQHKRDQMQQQQGSFVKIATINSASLKVSFEVALRIAKAKKPHNIAEELILPCAVDMVKAVVGESYVSKLRSIPLSNNTISRRISLMSEDVNEQLIDMLKSSMKFALQLDDSTDIANCSILMVYVRFINRLDAVFQEEFLHSEALPTRTTGEEIFRVLDKFISDSDLQWVNCVGVTSDGAAAMTGPKSGLVQRIKNVAPNAVSYHCFIHREALAAKDLGTELHEVLNIAVKIVNFIKASSLNTRLFEMLCREMGSDYVHLLLHSHIRWLSAGHALERLFELRREVHEFLVSKNSTLADNLVNTQWVAHLSYLVDMFRNLNVLNLGLQGRGTTIFTVADKVTAFMKKLQYWEGRAGIAILDIFPSLTDHLCSLGDDADEIKANVIPTIINHLKLLHARFLQYFPSDVTEKFYWVRNPFATDTTKLFLSPKKVEQLIDLSCDATLKDRFQEVSLSDFWISVLSQYAELADHALCVLLPFATTYLCETGFSAMTAIKSKYRSRLSANNDLRLCLTTIKPRIDLLASKMQAQPAH